MTDSNIPPPLNYSSQVKLREIPVLSWPIAIPFWTVGFGLWTVGLFVLPKFEQIFKDFKMELPGVTKLVLKMNGALVTMTPLGFGNVSIPFVLILFTLAIVALPFLVTRLVYTSDPRDDVRQRERWCIRLLILFAGLIVAFIVISLFAPMISIIQTVSSPGGKK